MSFVLDIAILKKNFKIPNFSYLNIDFNGFIEVDMLEPFYCWYEEILLFKSLRNSKRGNKGNFTSKSN